MSSFKVREEAHLMGGVNTPSNATNTISGHTTVSGSLHLGSVGTNLGGLLFGSTIITVGSATSGSSASSVVQIANAATTDYVFAIAGSVPLYSVLTGASVTTASYVTFEFTNTGSTTSAEAAVTMQYLILRP
jgi:hypothetical protein